MILSRRVIGVRGKLIVISGPSGVGKGTILSRLFEDSSLNLAFSISMTTRNPRDQEQEGIHYFFVDKKTFIKNIEENMLLEHAQYNSEYYGTPKNYVDQLLDEGKNVVLEIEVQGALQVMNARPDTLTIFIAPPTYEELERRLRNRGTETEDKILERLAKAKHELTYQNKYQYIVVNDHLDSAIEETRQIIKHYIQA